MRARCFFIAFMLIAAWFAATPNRANACGNEVQLEENEEVQLLVAAQQALDDGDYPYVIELVGSDETVERFAGLERADRAVRLWALAQSRSGRRVDSHIAALREQRARRSATISPFRSESADPVLDATLGEVLARAAQVTEARALLRPLADADIMPSPYAWAALAQVEAAEPQRAKLARARCIITSYSNPGVCDGNMPTPPVLLWLLRRAPPMWALLVLQAVLILAFVIRKIVERRLALPNVPAPLKAGSWRGAASVIAFGVGSLWLARFSVAAAACSILASFVITTYLDRKRLASALQEGKVAGYTFRKLTSEDDLSVIPRLTWLVTSGSREYEILTFAPSAGDSAYRTAEARAVARLDPLGTWLTPKAIAMALLLALPFVGLVSGLVLYVH